MGYPAREVKGDIPPQRALEHGRGGGRMNAPSVPLRAGVSTYAPCGGDLGARRPFQAALVSTHAPLAGGDGAFPDIPACKAVSTHAPLAGGDHKYHPCCNRHQRFNSRPPCGGRHCRISPDRNPCQFQLTPPLRGATRARGRHDPITNSFNSRPPCGGRHQSARMATCSGVFQLTPPLRGATVASLGHAGEAGVSTHAPLAGGDRGATGTMQRTCSFNSRPPCGGRRGVKHQVLHARLFQLTPPLRGATPALRR